MSSGSGARPAHLEDPPRLKLLLGEEERRLLDAARELGCEVSVVDPGGEPVLGPPPPPAVLADRSDSAPWCTTIGGREYLCAAVFHDGEALCYLVCSPIGPEARGEGRARGLRTAHYLLRMSEALVLSALRRALATRVHLLHVEEAYCELQLRTQRLEQAVQRMRESERIKNIFLATVSHELRTPLTSVIGYTEMLLEGLAGPLSDEQRDYLQIVMDKSDQLHQLITKLLDVSRIESTGVTLSRVPVDLRDLLREVLTFVAAQLRRKRTRVELQLPEDLPALHGDYEKLRQVLVNLIANAVKFTPECGEVKVVARELPATESKNPPHKDRDKDPGEAPAGGGSSSDGGGGWVQLSIIDNGIGIPLHLHEKVFDLFYQVDSSVTREHQGSGLGLSIVRKYVEAHGGRVWIEDQPERGCIFHLILPALHGPA
ncbi:MAG: HAMP domain-containing sensor histidine kinase [Polyangia bacterium]